MIPFMAYWMYGRVLRLRDALDSSTLKVPVRAKEQKAAMKAELEERLLTLGALFRHSVRQDISREVREKYRGAVEVVLSNLDRTAELEPLCDLLQEYPATLAILDARIVCQDVKNRMSGFNL